MSAQEATAFLGALAVVLSLSVPLGLRWLDAKAKARATSEVTMEAINRAISVERDSAVGALKAAKVEFDRALTELTSTHNGEVARLTETHNGEISRLTEQLVACKTTVDQLYRELYIAKRSPPSG